MIPVPGVVARLYCAVCLYTRTGSADDAETIIAGTAVCYDHMGLLAQSSPQLSRAVAIAKGVSITEALPEAERGPALPEADR